MPLAGSRIRARLTRWVAALRIVIALLAVVALTWLGWSAWTAYRFNIFITSAKAQMAAGRFGTAARSLEQALALRPNSDQAAYVLGQCEQARGQIRAADQAWQRVRPGSPYAHNALVARLRLLHDAGNFTGAERLVMEAARDPRSDASKTLVLVVPIHSETGRGDEAERLIEARWQNLYERGEATPDESIKLVRLHIELSLRPPSVEAVGMVLEQAGRVAAGDDRVWLGRANLAIRRGAYGEVPRWLDACRRRRPDDSAVWRASLNWSLATHRTNDACEAMTHLKAANATHAEVHRLAAWLAAHRREEFPHERRQLELAIAAEPSDLSSLDLLIERARQNRDTTRAARLEGQKTKINELIARYLKLFDRVQHMRDAEEMASIAHHLGREFEARVFLTLAILQDPEREDLRRQLSQRVRARATSADRAKTLAEVVEDELREKP
jgi:thioredoxin-like negative regulator of GroEL